MTWELRHGLYQRVLADDDCQADAAFVDAPYSSKTHEGHNASGGEKPDGSERKKIGYDFWTELEVNECVAYLHARTAGWIVSVTDNVLLGAWARALAQCNRYVFDNLPFVSPGSRVRQQGDGPSGWTCWMVVARPRTKKYAKWGTLRGAYIYSPEKSEVMGGKPLAYVRAVLRDYTKPGDRVIDPCAGWGTTLRAACLEGRRSIGAEADDTNYAKAMERLNEPYTPPIFQELQEPEQRVMF